MRERIAADAAVLFCVIGNVAGRGDFVYQESKNACGLDLSMR